MIRRILSAITAVIGLVVIALAVCSATIWRPSDTAQATLAKDPTQPYVVVEPGVLGLVDNDVTVTATASGKPVVIAVAYSSDAHAWLADDPYVSVTGLTDWDTLKSQDVTKRCAPADSTSTDAATDAAATDGADCTDLVASGANPASSDLWQKVVTGEGSVKLDLDAAEKDLVLVVATDGTDPAPQISMTWPRKVETPYFIPGLVLGGVLLMLGVAGLLMGFLAGRAERQRRQLAAERAAHGGTGDMGVAAGAVGSGNPDRPLTRREKREKERAEADGDEWIDPRTGVVYVGGVEAPSVPAVPVEAETGVLAGGAAGEAYDADPAAQFPQEIGPYSASDGVDRGDAAPVWPEQSAGGWPQAEPVQDAQAWPEQQAGAWPQDQVQQTQVGGWPQAQAAPIQAEPVQAQDPATAWPQPGLIPQGPAAPQDPATGWPQPAPLDQVAPQDSVPGSPQVGADQQEQAGVWPQGQAGMWPAAQTWPGAQPGPQAPGQAGAPTDEENV